MKATQGKKKIGRGAFSTVYKETDTTVLIVSSDPVKECMSLGWFPESPLFPEVERVEISFDEKGNCLYRMEYLSRPSSLKKNLDAEHWKIYKTLRDYFSTLFPPFQKDRSYEVLKAAFQDCLEAFPECLEALENALEALANYGSDMWFEISPRNVAVKDGKLILLDCFFMQSKLKEVQRLFLR